MVGRYAYYPGKGLPDGIVRDQVRVDGIMAGPGPWERVLVDRVSYEAHLRGTCARRPRRVGKQQ